MARLFAVLAALAATGLPATAFADQPRPWQLGLQDAATPVMERIVNFHDALLVVISVISAFVLALLLYVIFRFNERRNPTPSRTAHNTLIEVLWTALPVIILIGITIPSIRLIWYADRTQDADMTIKAIGHQWYWSYEYPDNGNFTFDALLVPDSDLQPGQLRLLETDNRIVLPVDTNIRLLVTATDVIHSWAIPAFGVKLDTVPGRVNETWMRITREGTYYGQCSELCGIGHGYMPIAVEAVSKPAFDAWVAEAQVKFARADGAATRLAQGAAAN
ncbi:MAG: cytochrome c oxidase subunit II [Dongiaceae bacterium]